MSRSSASAIGLSALAALLLALPSGANAQAAAPATASTAALTGTVLDEQQHPVADAQVRLSGPIIRTTQSASNGTFAFRAMPQGLFRVDVSKGGFSTSFQSDVALASGTTAELSITLRAASFSSLRQIGSVSVTANGRNAINTSPASIAVVSGGTFAEQGQLSVGSVLNELPGIVVSPPSNNGGAGFLANASSPLATGVPQIRGALPYETASLIDGHPISIGQYGTFNPVFINPYVLQDVEVVKGPGATAPNIDYAIGGTVNFRTLEPTREQRVSVDGDYDQFGGNDVNVRATGKLEKAGLSYAFDYAVQGTQGYDRGFTSNFAPISFYGPYTLNGAAPCTAGQFPCTFGVGPGTNPNLYGVPALHANLVLCCQALPMNSSKRNELAKIRYAFAPTTSLTLTYLGAQTRGSLIGGEFFSLPITTFTPPAGYAGSLAAGTSIPFDLASSAGSIAETNANLFQAELRTALGRTATLLGRFYAAGVQTFDGGPGDRGPSPGNYNLVGNAYGGVPLNTDPGFTIYNGTPSTFAIQQSFYANRSRDRLNGYTFEVDKQLGDQTVSLSYDRVKTSSFADTEATIAAYNAVNVPDGSSQTFDTLMLRGQFALAPGVRATLSNNYLSYTDRYTQDGGLSFDNSTHYYNAPRASFTWRAPQDLVVRAAAGFSIAPPYINLLTNTAGVFPSQINPPTYYQTTANSGDLAPETSFGFDFGFDKRFSRNYVVSFDAYDTTLRNQFLTQTSVRGTFTPPSGPNAGVTLPLYVTKTANLGHSRYTGIEAALRRDPAVGFGFKVQGALMRAYPYDLPSGFYDTAAGPNTTNQGVIANVNFQGSGFLFNGLSFARVPYSMGYLELNRRAGNGAYVLAGLTYYGPNNGFNQPAFAVGTASFTQPLTKKSSLMLSIYNFTNAYPNFYYNFVGGVPVPLRGGSLGATPGNVIGPSTAQLFFHYSL